MIKVDIIAGARPNFMKIAPIIHEMNHRKKLGAAIEYRLVHTGQHYDEKMSGSFFKQLNIPEPDINLGVGSGTQAEQTGRIMVEYEKAIADDKPNLTIVVGDVTSTMATTIVAKKAGVTVAHVEGGIRSSDMAMPEEVNRIVTDSITDIFYTTSEVANKNLRKQGFGFDQIVFVGNTMIDTLLANQERLEQPAFFNEFELSSGQYLAMTMHRPRNVDDASTLAKFIKTIDDNVEGNKVVFPIHPRTRKIFNELNIDFDNIAMVEPLGYLQFIYLIKHSRAIITDSGGITEEATVLGIPCMTLRDNTERPETVTIGTNEMVGTDPDKLLPYLNKLFAGEWKKGGIPELWDGKTASRIVEHILSHGWV